MATNRPNPAQWVWYAFGGKLPQRCAEWVFHDATCPTWWLRHIARTLTQLLPFAAALMLFPGPLSIRLSALTLGLLVGIFYSLCLMGEMAEHRIIKHGYPPGIGRDTRALRKDMRRAAKYGFEHRPWWE